MCGLLLGALFQGMWFCTGVNVSGCVVLPNTLQRFMSVQVMW